MRRVSAARLAYNHNPEYALLVNRPIAKKGIRRIGSPFTVESHSPWVHVSPRAIRNEPIISARDVGIRENTIAALATSGISVPTSESREERWHLDGIVPWIERLQEDAITHEAPLRGTGERVALATIPDDRSAGPPWFKTWLEEQP